MSIRGRNPEQAIQSINDQARPLLGYVYDAPGYSFTSYRDIRSGEHVPCYVMATNVRCTANGKQHTVVLGVTADDQGKPRVDWWCGDRLLTGQMQEGELDKSVVQTMGVLTEVDPKVSPRVPVIADEMRSSFGTQPVNAPCGFWKQAKEGKVCKHVAFIFDEMKRHRLTGMSLRKTLQGMVTELSSYDHRAASVASLYAMKRQAMGRDDPACDGEL